MKTAEEKLRELKMLTPGHTEFIIYGEFGKVELVEIMESYAKQKAVEFARHCRDNDMVFIDFPDYDEFNKL